MLKKRNKIKGKFIFFLLLMLLCYFLFPLLIPKLKAEIQLAEVQSLVIEKKLNKKINYLDINFADEVINNKNGITVLFSIPSGKLYTEIIDVFKNSQQMSLFNRTLYIYPIIYQSREIEQKFNIDKNQVTVIFFENGEAKNQLLITQELDIKNDLIPLLNQLPLTAESVDEFVFDE